MRSKCIALGPGLLESAYEHCLARELSLNDIPFRIQAPIPVEYKGVTLDCGYRIDVLVDEEVILELKSVERILDIRSPAAHLHEIGKHQYWVVD